MSKRESVASGRRGAALKNGDEPDGAEPAPSATTGAKAPAAPGGLLDRLGPRWTPPELHAFFSAHGTHGPDWDAVAAALAAATPPAGRTPGQCEALFDMNRSYLSLPPSIPTNSAVLIAMYDDQVANLVAATEAAAAAAQRPPSAPGSDAAGPRAEASGGGIPPGQAHPAPEASGASSDGGNTAGDGHGGRARAVGKRTPRGPPARYAPEPVAPASGGTRAKRPSASPRRLTEEGSARKRPRGATADQSGALDALLSLAQAEEKGQGGGGGYTGGGAEDDYSPPPVRARAPRPPPSTGRRKTPAKTPPRSGGPARPRPPQWDLPVSLSLAPGALFTKPVDDAGGGRARAKRKPGVAPGRRGPGGFGSRPDAAQAARLPPSLRRWCAAEFFYCPADRAWFRGRAEMADFLRHVGLGGVTRLTRSEWGLVRTEMARPHGRYRRLSRAFLAEERAKLAAWREAVRAHHAECLARPGGGIEPPPGCPRPLAVGTAVTARHPRDRQLHAGAVLTVERGRYRVQFSRPELGVELVRDTEVMPLGAASPSDAAGGVGWGGEGGGGGGGRWGGASRRETDARALAEVDALLGRKRRLVSALRALNDEAASGAAFEPGGRYGESFQRTYAAALVELKAVNADLQAGFRAIKRGPAGEAAIKTEGGEPASPVAHGRRISLVGGSWAAPLPPSADRDTRARLGLGGTAAGVLTAAAAAAQRLVDDAVAGAADLGPGALGMAREEVAGVLSLVQGCCGALLALQRCAGGGEGGAPPLGGADAAAVLDGAVAALRPRARGNAALHAEVAAAAAGARQLLLES